MTQESNKDIHEDLSIKLALAKKIDDDFLCEKFKVERLIGEIFSSIEKHSSEFKTISKVFPEISDTKFNKI